MLRGQVSWGYYYCPKVISAHWLNFKPTFRSVLNNFLGGGALAKVGHGHSIARAKFQNAAHLRGRNTVFLKSQFW